MNIINDIYQRSLAENEKNLSTWEDYLQKLNSLDFSSYSDKLKVPSLVPVGSRILFRGELKHTNEVTVAIGADYFAKCSLAQAEILRQHRIKKAESHVEKYRNEREYLENHLSFSTDKVFQNEGQEIIEMHTQEEDKEWREKHRENLKKWKQEERKEREEVKAKEIRDEELWNRLEELELQEELENELSINDDETSNKNSFIVEEETLFDSSRNKVATQIENHNEPRLATLKKNVNEVKVPQPEPVETNPEYEIMQRILAKQEEIEEKLAYLTDKDRPKTQAEVDFIAKLDELEELDDLQDDMYRLEQLVEMEDADSDEEEDSTYSSQETGSKKQVSFADEDDSETVELFVKHSKVEPNKQPYDPTKGIKKPSDIYEAFSHFFAVENTSILKKSKYKCRNINDNINNYNNIMDVPKVEKKAVVWAEPKEETDIKTIVVKDIVERENNNEMPKTSEKRPMSLFKQKRLQNKS